MKFDSFTLFFTYGIIDLFIATIFAYYILVTKPQKWFVTGYLVHRVIDFFVFVGLSLRNKIPDFISVDLANIFYFSNSVLLIISISSYRGTLNRKYLMLMSGIALAIIISFLAVSENASTRVIVSSFGAFVLFGIASAEMLKNMRPYKMPLIISISFFAFATVNLIRGINIVVTMPNGYDPMNLGIMDILLSFTIIFSILFSTVGFLLLIRETDELEIKSKNRFIQISLDQSPVDIIVTNIDGNILYANPQYKKSVGLEDKDILNKKAQIFTSNINQTENTDEILHEMNQGKSWQGEIDVLDANGHLNTKKVVLAPLIIGVNEDKNVIMYQIDITQSKINQALIQKQNEQLNSHIKAKDKFISVLAHDLRSPIAGFYQLTTLMYKNFKNYEPDALRNMLELLNRNAYNNFQLLDNLLQWAKSFQKNIMFNRKPINLKIFIDDSILNLQEYSNLKNILILNNVTENIEILGHPEMLKTILRNLIINATKYTPNNGSINISAREDEQYTYISVSDTGIGMSEHVRENLFKLEETKTLQGTNGEQGTGFGLVICNDFVLKHQGKIWVESEPNKGSTFSFSFSRT